MKKHLHTEVLFTPKEMMVLKGTKSANEWFYRRLAEGDSALDHDAINKIADQLGIAFRSCGYFCAVVREMTGNLPFALLQSCRAALKSMQNDSFCYIGDGLCAVILLSDDHGSRQAVVAKLQAILKKNGVSQIQIGVGRTYENLEMVSHSRIEASEALSGVGTAACISYIDDIYVMRSLTTRKLDGEKRKIVEHFKAGRLEEMMTDLTLLAEIVRSESPVREGMPYPTSIRRTILELLFEIMHISADAGVDVDKLLGYQDPYAHVFAFNGTPFILSWFSEVAGELYKSICEIANNNQNMMLLKAQQCMAAHLSDPELCLSLVSDALGITPTYFSAFFIREVGVGFNEYITNLRIERAKKLLSLTNRKVSDIAVECGFRSASYFNSVFRKQTGMSPGAFRNMK
jgi:two-component system response regulator YesN